MNRQRNRVLLIINLIYLVFGTTNVQAKNHSLEILERDHPGVASVLEAGTPEVDLSLIDGACEFPGGRVYEASSCREIMHSLATPSARISRGNVLSMDFAEVVQEMISEPGNNMFSGNQLSRTIGYYSTEREIAYAIYRQARLSSIVDQNGFAPTCGFIIPFEVRWETHETSFRTFEEKRYNWGTMVRKCEDLAKVLKNAEESTVNATASSEVLDSQRDESAIQNEQFIGRENGNEGIIIR